MQKDRIRSHELSCLSERDGQSIFSTKRKKKQKNQIKKKGNKHPLETNPYDCATNNDNYAKKGNKESLEPDPYDCATDNGKLLED